MKTGVIGIALCGVVVASSYSPSTGSAAGQTELSPLTATKQLVSPWRRTKTNEWVRYHYPKVPPPVYKEGRPVQPQAVVKGWFETNNTAPIVETRTARPKTPPPEPPNLDDPKSLRDYALKNGLIMAEIVAPRTSCSGGG